MEWDDPKLGVRGEPAHRAQRRRLQSWWRQAELRAAAGRRPRRKYPVGNLLSVSDIEAQPWLNFLHPAAYAHAESRITEVQAEGGTLEPDRLRRNLLSSMPLCFNVFGALGNHPEFCWLLRRTFAPDAVEVTDVICEWSPRPKARYLTDNTAFDAAIFFIDDLGRRCVLGVEVKYTDDFSKTVYDTCRYRAVTGDSGWFAPGAADRLKQPEANQLWRNTLLAASLEQDPAVDRALVGVLALQGDAGAEAAMAAVRSELDDQGRLVNVSLEALVVAADPHPEFGGWATDFRNRYLEPVDDREVLPVTAPAPARVLLPPERAFEDGDGYEPPAEPLSWQVAAHLLGGFDGLGQVVETHPGGGEYDCLTLLPRATDDTFRSIDLNRVGSAFVWRAEPANGWWWAWRGIWDELDAGCSPAQAAALIAHHAGLAPSTRPWPASALTASAIGSLLQADLSMRCVNGMLDTSGYGGGIRAESFEAMGLTAPLEVPDAYRWWFLLRDDQPELAVELPRGRALLPNGSALDMTDPGVVGTLRMD